MSEEQLEPCPYSNGLMINCPKESVPMVKNFLHAIASNPIEDALRAKIAELEAENEALKIEKTNQEITDFIQKTMKAEKKGGGE